VEDSTLKKSTFLIGLAVVDTVAVYEIFTMQGGGEIILPIPTSAFLIWSAVVEVAVWGIAWWLSRKWQCRVPVSGFRRVFYELKRQLAEEKM
jgi:hypothetical protein